MSLRPSCSTKQDLLPTQEDHQARFYEDYRKVAEEYDKEFLKKYDEDLNTTLIFVGSSRVIDERLLLTGYRLVYSPRLPLPLSSRSTHSSNPIPTKRPPRSFAFLFTRLTTPPLETMSPLFHNGPGLPSTLSKSKPSSSPVSLSHSFPPSWLCLANNG
jgi:hypothetical protein